MNLPFHFIDALLCFQGWKSGEIVDCSYKGDTSKEYLSSINQNCIKKAISKLTISLNQKSQKFKPHTFRIKANNFCNFKENQRGPKI